MLLVTDYYLDDGAFPPERARPTDAGLDFKTPVDFYLKSHESVVIDLGIHILIPRGYVGFLKSRSGLNIDVCCVCDSGVIDPGYSGSIVMRLYNNGKEDLHFDRGNKIVQMVFLKMATPSTKQVSKELFEQECAQVSDRGDSGFGSTGR